jgi:hypothetical protein
MGHAFGKAYLLVVATHGTLCSCHTLEVLIDTSVGTGGIGQVLSYEPSQTVVAQWAALNVTYGIAFLGLLD